MGACDLCPSHVALFSLDVSEYMPIPPSNRNRVPLLSKLTRFDEDVPVQNRSMYNFPCIITLCIVINVKNLQS